ncbi:mucin-5AC-like [Cololabis saira]|uniref:mucin-5AC-like n=1 Tax=Cololabis saira TaxID=129043 RepID=UPI002AD4DC38|nr:mucin-5AC-like [Cololabis saira]
MSAEDIHSMYASTMESMLKSAMAETTKLFESMVNDLKAEITQMRKENEDLKTRVGQSEPGPGQAAERTPERGHGAGKCDSAVQCDLSPIPTGLVDECQQFGTSVLQNQDQQLTNEQIADSSQEHNYVCQGNSDSNEMCNYAIQTCVLKQEEVESSGAYKQVSSDNMGSESASLPTFQRWTSEELTSGNPVQNVTPSLVISLKDAFSDDIKEEPEYVQMAEETDMQDEHRTSENLVPPECCQNESTAKNEQTEAQSTEQQVEESALVKKQSACEELNHGSAKASSEPNEPPRRKRGRPPKKKGKSSAKVLKNKDLNTSSVAEKAMEASSGNTEDKISTETSTVTTSSVQENVSETQNTAQAASGVLKRHYTSASLQDAMLLVEAMNQSPVERTISPSVSTAQPPAPLSLIAGTTQMLNKPPVKPQICITTVGTHPKAGTPDITLCVKSATSSKACNVVVIPKQHSVPPRCSTKQENSTSPGVAAFLGGKVVRKTSQTIIIVPGPGKTFATPQMTLKSHPRLTFATANCISPKPAVAVFPKTNPPSPVPKSVKGTVQKCLPYLPIHAKTITSHQESKTPQKQRIAIVIPPPPVAVSLNPELVANSETDRASAAGFPVPTPDPGSSTDSVCVLDPTPASDLRPTPASDLDPTADTEDTDPGPNLDTDPTSDLDPSPASDLDPSPASDLDPTPVSDLDPTPVSDLDPTPVSDLDPTPVSDLDPTPASDLDLTPASDLDPTPVSDLDPTPASDLDPTPASDLDPTPASDLSPSPASDLSPSPASDLSPSPASDLSPSPASDLSPSPASDLSPSPASDLSPSPASDLDPPPASDLSPPPASGLDPPPACGLDPPPACGLDPTPASDLVPTPASDLNPTPACDLVPIPASVPDPIPASVPDPIPASVPDPIPVSVPDPDLSPASDWDLTYDHNPDTDPNYDLVCTDSSIQLISTSQQSNSSISAPLTPLFEKISTSKTIDNLGDSKQAACVSEMINASTDTCLSPEVVTGQVPTPASSVLLPNAKQKLHAVVRLTRLPFPVTTKESILVSKLPKVMGKQKPSERPVLVSQMPVLSHLKTSEKPEVSSTVGTVMKEEEPLPVPDSPNKAAFMAVKNNLEPNLEITKSQFLTKLLLSPAQEKESRKKNSQPKTSIVARLRNHLKDLETKAAAKKCKADTDINTNGPKKSRLDDDHSYYARETTTSNLITNTPLSNSFQSGVCRGTAAISVCEAASVKSGKTTRDPAAVSVKRFSPESDTVGSNDIKSPSAKRSKSKEKCPSPTIINQIINIAMNKRSPPASPRMTSCTQESSHPKITSTINTKSPFMSSKISPREGAGLQSTLSVCLEKIPDLLSYPSSFTITKASTSIKPVKSQSNVLSPGKNPETTVSGKTEESNGEDILPSVKAEDDIDDIDIEISTPTSGSEADLKVNATKTAKTRKRKEKAAKRRRIQSKTKKEFAASRDGRKCRAVVWYPPTLPPNEVPSLERRRPKPIPVEDKVPVIPYKKAPMISPLQPLAVIGKYLLRNQCGECGRIFSSSSALESHAGLHAVHHPFYCTFCGKSFPDSKSFNRHHRVHRNGRIHICPKCGKGFVYRFGLTKHLVMVHSKIKPFVCQLCNKGYYSKREVEVHIRSHTGERPFHCHLCEKKFKRRVELNTHLRWHNGEKRHWCPYCEKGFLDYNNLKRHKYTHTGEKPYSCPHCSKQFAQTGHMKKHIRNAHEDDWISDV